MFVREGLIWSIIIVLLSGCGTKGPAKYHVSGTVKMDGQPIPRGYIVFSPADGKIAPDGGNIIDGKFEFLAQAGSKRIEIDASRPSDRPADRLMKTPPIVSYIPSRYNTQTELTAEVSATGTNQFAFPLKTDNDVK